LHFTLVGSMCVAGAPPPKPPSSFSSIAFD
jgi:hypothetical protein